MFGTMIDNLLILFLVSMTAVLSEAQSADQHCLTPDNRNGDCINIQSCEILLKMVNKNYISREDISFLRHSRCGTKSAGVCCPSDAEAAERFTTPTPTNNTPIETLTTTLTPATIESAIRISSKKCNEYSDFAYNKTYTANVLSDIPRVTKTSNCAFLAQGLVVGGEEAKRREFPHMALIGFRYNDEIHWDCAGTLISEQFVLSSLCCYCLLKGPALYVRLGEHDLSKTNDANHQDFDIIEKIYHQNVTATDTVNNIVLFKLDREVEFNHAIRPACLPEQFTVPINVSASGWGRLAPGETVNHVLQKVDMTTFSSSEPNRNSTDGRNMDESMVFARLSKKRKETCDSDLGGPLQFIHNTQHCMYVVVGVKSSVEDCGDIEAVYTRVYNHLDWIVKTVWPNE